MSRSDHEAEIEDVAASIEDLLKMGIIKFDDSSAVGNEKVILSANFSFILSKMITDLSVTKDDGESHLKALYYAFHIYLDEELNVPQRLTMALANDIEKFQDSSESSKIVRRYVTVLYNILQNL
ncbi:MAG TPA: hypothetical protein VE130_07340 [Nitrososphaeraceae archaeon]|jgi:hypothetical protein|nr:hypothetical protein [Nitrososphaeraceae archaeon]